MYVIIVGKKEELMFDPNEAFENENEENGEYNPLDDDLEFDDFFVNEILSARGMKFALDGFKMFLDSIRELTDQDQDGEVFDWYESFIEQKRNNKNPLKLIIDTQNPHLVEYAHLVISLPKEDPKVVEIQNLVDSNNESLEFSKILDAFGYFETQLKTINTIEDLLKEFGNE